VSPPDPVPEADGGEPAKTYKLVSTAADITEILDGLGHGGDIVLADVYSAGAGSVNSEVCTMDYLNPDVEAIIALSPDCVFVSGSSTDPRLHQTTLLMWSNYSQQQVDFGTIAAYDISPVMMELFGLEQPLYFQFLNRQLRVASRSCTRGTTMNLDGTTTQQPTEFQQRWTNEHWMLQYDLMFGKGYALNRMGVAGLSGMNTGK